MRSIKKCVKKPNKILQQIRNNFEEKSIVIEKENIRGDKRKGKLIKVNGTDCYLSNCFPNNFCLLKHQTIDDIGTIVKITRFKNNVFYGVALSNPQNFYMLPVPSKQLGIALIESIKGGREFELDVNVIKCKLMCLPYKHQFITLPILHNCV